jgi:hypothetical protein
MAETQVGPDGGQAPVPAPTRPRASLASWLVIPVFFDHIWEDSATQSVAYIVVCKMIKCLLVVITQATDFIKKDLKKKKPKAVR